MTWNGAYFAGLRSAQSWIAVGAGLFLIALLVSAVSVPELRILHSFQALIYVAVVVLTCRNSAWGYGAGFSIAVVWNSMGIFVTHLIQAGVTSFWMLLRTGHAGELVPMAVALGALGHFILICSALLAVTRLGRDTQKWWKFAGGGAISLAYFALLVTIFQPH